MSKVHGYITLDADTVVRACDAYAAARNARHEESKAAHIKSEMNKRWFRAKTEEEALRRAMVEHTNVPFWEWRGLFSAEKVETLRSAAATAAKTANDLNRESRQVLVSIDMAETLQKYF